MTDKGRVIASGNNLAEVEVNCLEGCHDCTVRTLCIGNKQNKGRLSVKNPLRALPGDEVRIEIPDEHYSQALILLFGGLLCALLLGMGCGYVFSRLFAIPVFLSSFVGLVGGLTIGSLILFRIFRQKNKDQLYPVIIDIINKGDCYGSA